MFCICVNANMDQSGMPMLWQGVGLTLSYSFLG